MSYTEWGAGFSFNVPSHLADFCDIVREGETLFCSKHRDMGSMEDSSVF